MAERILKEITTYEKTDNFQKFRETLVNEVSENFEIVEERLQKLGNGELVLLGTTGSISSWNGDEKRARYSFLTKSELPTLENCNYLHLLLNIESNNCIFKIDLRPSKLKTRTTYCFDVTLYPTFRCGFKVEINETTIKFWLIFDDEASVVTDSKVTVYGSK